MRGVRDESGMTLIELLIAVVITVTLVGAATAAFTAGLTNSKDTDTAFAESHDAQLLETYLPVDIQSAQDTAGAVDTTFTTAPASGCAAVLPAQSYNLVKFTWTEASKTYTVSYRVEPIATTTEWQLIRYACDTGSPGATKALTVGHGLLAPTSSAWTTSGSPATTCGTRVSVTIHEASSYAYTITGNRRTPPTAGSVCSSFTMGVTPASQSVGAGASATYTVTVTPTGGFIGGVALSSPDLGAAGTFAPTSLSFAAGDGAKTSTLTVNTSGMTGTISFTVVGTSGATTRSATASVTITVVGPPDLLQVEMFDGKSGAGTGAPDGKIDELIALFSQPLTATSGATTCTTYTDWTLASPPAGAVIPAGSVTRTDSTHLDIKLTPGAIDTAAAAFNVNYTPTHGCNANSASAVDVLDRAGPVGISVTSPVSSPGGNGTPAAGDTIQITFSESITACPSSTSVGLTSDNSNNDTLTLPGVAQGGIAIGTGYLKKKNESASFANSGVACSGSNLTVTVGSTCSGPDCGDLKSGSGSFTLLPDPGIKDLETPVSNSVVSTVAIPGGTLF